MKAVVKFIFSSSSLQGFIRYRLSKRSWVHIGLILLFTFISPQLQAAPSLQPSQIQLNNLSFDQLQQAAEAGDPDAQYALGYMYYYGKNVPQNTQTALNWIKRAAVQGQSQAINAMSLLGQSNVPPSAAQTAFYPQAEQPPPTAKKTTRTSIVATSVEASTTDETSTNVSTLANKAPSGHYYTIQLLASANKDELNKYINTYNLQGKATYSQTKRQGKNWYVLTYGNYKSKAEAQAGINTLPAAVRAQKPWVKSMGDTSQASSKPASSKSAAKSTTKTAKPTNKKSTHKKTSSNKDQALSF